MGVFKLEIITPKGVYLETEVESLTIKLTSGYRTILKGHAPLIGAIGYDEMHTVKGNVTNRYAVHGGVLNVTLDKVVLLVNGIENEKDIDLARAEAARDRAKERLESKDPSLDVKRATLALNKALARINTVSNK